MFARSTLTSFVVAPWLLISACGDVAHCPRGEAGCLEGVVLSNGGCKFDLVPSSGRCVRPGDAKSTPSSTGYCAPWSTSDKLKLVPDAKPARCNILASKDAFYASMTDGQKFDQLCYALCMQDQVHGRAYCGTSVEVESCSVSATPAIREACKAQVQAASPTATTTADMNVVLQRLCNETATAPCADTVCAEGMSTCDALPVDLCTDTCKLGDAKLTGDGICDDGDTLSAETSDCAYGTDCSDCGPRTERQATRPKPAAVGEACVANPGCKGFSSNFANSTAFCAAPTSASANMRCLPGCNDGRACPDGTECNTVTVSVVVNGKSVEQEYRISANLSLEPAMACFPILCE
jgi:hypothetical protein